MLGAMSGLTSAKASIDVSTALPIAVPIDVVRPSIASVRRSRSVVGGTTTRAVSENATIPNRVPSGCSSTNDRAASVATDSRFGSTSVEHIERDTSRVRMIGRAARSAP